MFARFVQFLCHIFAVEVTWFYYVWSRLSMGIRLPLNLLSVQRHQTHPELLQSTLMPFSVLILLHLVGFFVIICIALIYVNLSKTFKKPLKTLPIEVHNCACSSSTYTSRIYFQCSDHLCVPLQVPFPNTDQPYHI